MFDLVCLATGKSYEGPKSFIFNRKNKRSEGSIISNKLVNTCKRSRISIRGVFKTLKHLKRSFFAKLVNG